MGVWAAGIGARPVVKKLAQQLGQGENARGLKVDDRLQVLGADGVFAIGGCLGFGNAIAQLQPQHQAWRSLHSAANTKVVGEDQRAVTGAPAFALWRGMYFTQLL